MPNSFAYIALFSWPLVVIWLFRILPQSQAMGWSIIGGYLALPFGVGINPPVLPAFDKVLIPALSAAVMVLLGAGLPERSIVAPPGRRAGQTPGVAAFTRQMVRRATRGASDTLVPAVTAIRPGPIPRSVIILLALLIASSFLTVAGNGDPYQIGVLTLPGLSPYDAFSMVLNNMVMVLPFLLGLFCLGAPDRQLVLLRVFCLAGAIYTLPTLFEIRMSPQLSRWTYGFLAQSFAQTMRDSGFRPVVFLQHGLWLAIFLAMAALGAFALSRHEKMAGRGGGWALAVGLWLSGVLALCHSLGALAILVSLAPIVLFASVRVQMALALCITLVMLTYPMLRGAGLIPTQSLQDMAASVSADRAGSLKFRLDNEDRLLAHANQRPVAGWGGYGRSRIFDPNTGRDLSTTDGIWIIVMGVSGWLGYLATFGLLVGPVLILFWRRNRLALSLATVGLCLMLAANLIDMIPNATMTPLTWLIAGALAGRCRFAAAVQEAAPDQSPPRTARAPLMRRRAGSAAGAASRRRCQGAILAVGLVLGTGPASAERAIQPGAGLTNPSLAFGLSGIADWSTEMPFLDLMKSARPWIGHKDKTWSAMSYEDMAAAGYFDAQGWPKMIPDSLTSIGTIWVWDEKDAIAAASRKGIYVLTYKGEGTLNLALDVQVLQNRPGKILFRNLGGGQMILNIVATDPKHTGDYIRDIVIVPQQYEALQAAGEIFNPAWLALIEDARVLRFMDWMKVNGLTQASWDKRPQSDDATWRVRGVPVEVMVQLANQTGTEPWFNMPAGADEAYIRNFATYVRDHLNPALRAHVEYSNETWNWGFAQTHWMLDQAKSVWGTEDQAAYIDYNAMVSTKSALIWDAVFGAEAKARLDKVLGTQTVNTWFSERLLTAPLWQQFDPAGYVSPASVFNSLAVTTYFGGATMVDDALRSELLNVLKDPSIDASDWLKSRIEDPTYSKSIPQIVGWLQACKQVADKYGVKLVAYEGGQHLLQGFRIRGMTDQDQATLTAFLGAFARSPAMADLYGQIWAAWAQVGDGPFMQFTDVSAASKWGAWGLFSALGDHNPRADLLIELNAQTPAWFGTGGPQYQQGVIRLAGRGGDALMGTDRDDFLIGGTGDDMITPGKGHDAISGGAGMDTVFLSDAVQEYHLVAQMADGVESYRLTGPETDHVLRSVERVDFAGGISKTPEEMLKP